MKDAQLYPKQLGLTDLKYHLFYIKGEELRRHFPDKKVYFEVVVDSHIEFKTCIDNSGRIREGGRNLREWYERHNLKVGDTVYVRVIEPFKRYQFLVKPPGGVVNAAPPPSTSVALPPKLKRQRRAPEPSRANTISLNDVYTILDREIDSIQAYLTGRTEQHPASEKFCDWVQFCYTFEMYPEACALFALISPEEVNPWYWERTKKLARICQVKKEAL